jgi:uncharacterized membrane protein
MMTTIYTTRNNRPTSGNSATRAGVTLFAMPMGTPVAGLPTPTSRMPETHEAHHGWLYAIVALVSVTLILVGMGVYRYVQLQDTTSTTVATVPAEYAGVSLPQAMRLSDQAAVTGIPAEYAGVSLPQAMRLADLAAATGIPAEYAGVSLPQAMRLADLAAATGIPAEYAGVSLPQAMRLSDLAGAQE